MSLTNKKSRRLALESLRVGGMGLALVLVFGTTACTKSGDKGSAASKADATTFLYNIGNEPTTLNPITGTDAYNQAVQNFTMDSLMNRNLDTYEWEPALAEKAETSKDGKEFTFTVREGAKWSDGQPVTVEDVKFSFDVIFDTTYNAAHMRPYFENIAKAEVTGPRTIKFTTKSKYFGNFSVLASMAILPKHVYGDAEKGKAINKSITGSGPYMIDTYDKGVSIILKKNPNWWGWTVPEYKGRYNFEKIRLRFDKDENLALERLKKSELDFDTLTPEAFTKKTAGEPWGTTVLKKQVENSAPKPYGYIGWNFKKELFKDKKVRRALAMLMNRDEMNQKFRFGMSLPATGPWYQQSEYADPTVKAIAFDPKAAGELLKEAGWVDSNKDGTLDKGGKPFEFNLFYSNKDTEKYWVLYQEDLKKVGIKMNLQLLDWNALLKNMDESKFDAVALGWGGGAVDNDPKQIWHSSSIGKGGSNFISYSNKEVDKLIDKAREELDKQKRIPLYREIYRKIADDAPYAFMFNDKYILYAVNKRIQQPKDTFKFAIGTEYFAMKAAE